MHDYIHQDIYGYWEEIKQHPILNVYTGFNFLNFSDTFFALNIQILNPEKIPSDNCKKIVISYHTEYFEHQRLWDFFQLNSDCSFLFLCDTFDTTIWPNNVTCCQWITWGHQLGVTQDFHGIATDISIPKYKISSLSNRHEFHKAAVTAFILDNFDKSDIILSWNNWIPVRPYYLSNEFYMPDEIKKHLNGQFKGMQPILLDEFVNSPVLNGNWNHPAYLDCAINLTNESIYNTESIVNDNFINLPRPYLTEKTWKPLLAGRPFIPVGQANTFASLTKLGLEFNYGVDLTFDECVADFDRMILIYKCLKQLHEMSLMEIYQTTLDSTKHNLEHLRSGNFKQHCDLYNQQNLERISQW